MRNYLIAGNWKMNQNTAETAAFFSALANEITEVPQGVDVLVCPTFTSLFAALEGANTIKGVHIGAQNMHFENAGAYTGEINADMLNEIGITYVIIGHSERRQYFNETDETVNKKTKKALEKGLVPVLCVGELLSERKADKHFDIVKEQLVKGLEAISADDAGKVVIAYEPVWAIGTGETATPQQAQEMHAYIREVLTEVYNASVAASMQLLYGGSMNPKNAEELLNCKDVDGGLIGGASLKADTFSAMIKTAGNLKSN